MDILTFSLMWMSFQAFLISAISASSASPIVYSSNGTITVAQMEVPPEFYQDTEHSIFSAIRKEQTDTKFPFLLVKTYSLGSFSDGTMGIFFVNSSAVTNLGRLPGFGSLRSTIVYHDSNGDMAYFTTSDGTLWSIDGKTQEIAKVNVFTEDPTRWVGENSYLDSFCLFQDSMYFVANRTELWKSDGTSEGTTIVENLEDAITGVSVVDDEYLLLTVGINQVRASDGSSASTILTDEAGSPILRGWIQETGSGNQKAFFLDNAGVWVTEGTPDTTFPITDRRGVLYQHAVLEDGGVALLLMRDGYLFVTDGTEAGTRPLNATSVSDEAIEKGIMEYRNDDVFGTVSSFQSVIGLISSFDKRHGFLSTQGGRENVTIWTTDGATTNLVEAQIPYPTGLARLSEEDVLFRNENKLWAFGWNPEGLRLLVQFNESYAARSTMLSAFDDGCIVMSLQETDDGPVEFWTIQTSVPTNEEEPNPTDDNGEPSLPTNETSGARKASSMSIFAAALACLSCLLLLL